MRNCDNLKTGWLAPDGSFVPCSSFEHYAVSRKLVEKFGYPETIGEDWRLISADDNLLAHGWCYVGIAAVPKHEWRIKWIKFLTENQKQFLKPYFEENDLPVNEFSVMLWKQEVGGNDNDWS